MKLSRPSTLKAADWWAGFLVVLILGLALRALMKVRIVSPEEPEGLEGWDCAVVVCEAVSSIFPPWEGSCLSCGEGVGEPSGEWVPNPSSSQSDSSGEEGKLRLLWLWRSESTLDEEGGLPVELTWRQTGQGQLFWLFWHVKK